MYYVGVVIEGLFNIYYILIVIYCIMSWIPRGAVQILDDIRDAIGMLVEPYLSLFRRFIPPIFNIDFSPIVAILVLEIVEQLIFMII